MLSPRASSAQTKDRTRDVSKRPRNAKVPSSLPGGLTDERRQRLDHQRLQLAHVHRLSHLELREELHEAVDRERRRRLAALLGGRRRQLRVLEGCATRLRDRLRQISARHGRLLRGLSGRLSERKDVRGLLLEVSGVS